MTPVQAAPPEVAVNLAAGEGQGFVQQSVPLEPKMSKVEEKEPGYCDMCCNCFIYGRFEE